MKTSHVIALRIALTLAVIAALVLSAYAYHTATPPSDPEPSNPAAEIDWRLPDSDCYLIFATVSYYENGITGFVTQAGDIFTVTGEYPDAPYMLTMYGNHTPEVEDDMVCVVWTCVEGALG